VSRLDTVGVGSDISALIDLVRDEADRDWSREHASKVRLGMTQKRAEGARLGRPAKPFSRDEMILISRLRAEGKGWRRCAIILSEARAAGVDDSNERRRLTVSHSHVRRAVQAEDVWLRSAVSTASVHDELLRETLFHEPMLHLIAWLADRARKFLSERTKAGLAIAIRNGKRLGRPRVRIDLDTARALLSTGFSCRSVARQIGAAEATLRRALARTDR